MIIQKDETKLNPEFPFQITRQVLKKRDNTENSFHWHDFCEITCVESGQGKYFVNGHTYPVSAGDLLIFNNVELHGWWVEEEDMNLLVMIFPTEFIETPASTFEDSYLKPFLSRGLNFQNRISGENKHTAEIVAIIHDIMREWEEQRVGYRQMIKAQVLRVLTLLIRYEQDTETREESRQVLVKKKQIQRLENALYYINSHYSEKITLGEVAEAVYLSPNYFSSFFRRVLGIGFEDYLVSLRLKKAEELQKTTNLSVTEIANQCGFSNMSNYYRLRKKYVGNAKEKESENPDKEF